VVSAVGFSLLVSDMSEPIEYRELANRLGLEDGDQAPLGEVRQAVLGIRDQKGMLTTGQNATRSAGSFFMNPVIRPELAAELPPQAPKFELESGRVKTSAAWLIENAGFPKGYGRSAATLSPHHVLSIVNNGGAKASDVVELSAEIIAGVRKAFGITLVPEVVPVGVAFPKAAD
jgi:UDP-N-acetylmuramate dehydrogenase